MVDFDQIYLTAHTTPISERSRGTLCRFIRVNNNWGIKFYKDEKMRNKTHQMQGEASNIGAAPRVGDQFELFLPFYEHDDPIKVYGYVTECIQDTFANMEAMKMGYSSYEEAFAYDSDNETIIDDKFYSYQYYRMVEDLKKIGIEASDVHSMNSGHLKGRLVCIDFSDCEYY